MNGLLYSCRRAAELLSQAMDEPLDTLTRMRLRLHLSMCRDCARVEQQLAELRTLAGELGVTSTPAHAGPAGDGRRDGKPAGGRPAAGSPADQVPD